MPAFPRIYGTVLLLVAWLALPGWAAAWEMVPWDSPRKGRKPSPNLTAVAIPDRDHAFIGTSDGRLLHWDGNRMRAMDHPAKVKPRRFVVNAPDDVWAFGDNALSLHYDGRAWTRVKNPLTRRKRSEGRLWGAGCAAPDRCFAGTRDGRLIEWDGKEWRHALSPAGKARIYGMAFASRRSGWMVGDGFFARWDGTRWEKADMRDVPRMYDVVLAGNGRGWAVGDHGAVFEYDGTAWKKTDVPGSFFRLRAVACASPTDCWAAGAAGAVFGWDGARWQRTRLGTPERLTAVAMRDGQALLAGDRGTLFRRGPSPTPVESPAAADSSVPPKSPASPKNP